MMDKNGQNSGIIGRSTPSTLEMSLGLRPRNISRFSENLLGIGDGFPNASLVLMEHGYNAQRDVLSRANVKNNPCDPSCHLALPPSLAPSYDSRQMSPTSQSGSLTCSDERLHG